MGCVSSKLSEPILKGDEEINYRALAGPNHLVCLTSTTYGVFNNGSSSKASVSSPVEAAEDVETINAWELMDGLEDESPGPSPAVRKDSDKVGSLEGSVDVLGENRMGKSLGGSSMDGKRLGLAKENEKKLGVDKENESPQQAFGPVSTLKDRKKFVGKENFVPKDSGYNVDGVGLVRDIVCSTAPCDESLHIAAKGRTSCDQSLHFVGKENFGPKYRGYESLYIAKGRTSCDQSLYFIGKENFGPKDCGYESLQIAKGRRSCDASLHFVGNQNFQPLAKGYNVGMQGYNVGILPCNVVGTTVPYNESLHPAKGRISHGPLAELRIESSRHFDFCDGSLKDCIGSSSPLFDPELLASFETSLDNFEEDMWDDANSKSAHKKRDLWESYEEKCPPGGQDKVVLYTTTLRGIRKTFEDCNSVRCVLESYGICFFERDVSMHLPFRNELEKLMGRIVPVPRLFIKGRYIGGAGEVLELHEEGTFGELLEGIPADDTQGKLCDGCGGVRFVPCLECSGSCKLLDEEDNSMVRCPDCNENGLIQCPICC